MSSTKNFFYIAARIEICYTFSKLPSLTVKFIKTPLKALFYLGFSAVPFRFTI